MIQDLKEYKRQWWAAKTPEQKAKKYADQRARYAADPIRHRGYSQKHYKANPDKNRAQVLRKYGLTPAGYKAMLTGQNNSCFLCEEHFTETPYVDHDHKTSKVRGLLCQHCNTGLGGFKDSKRVLLRAAGYVSGGLTHRVTRDMMPT